MVWLSAIWKMSLSMVILTLAGVLSVWHLNPWLLFSNGVCLEPVLGRTCFSTEATAAGQFQ